MCQGSDASERGRAGRGDAMPRTARIRLGMDLFLDERGGYTSVSVAVALLVTLSLTLSLASFAWVQNRAADVQSVADSAALAGSNVVSGYATVATTLDACVLTMGLAGLVTLGAGLVVSAVPGLSAAGAQTVRSGLDILDARRDFATSAARGLQSLEKTLPLAIAARSAAATQANDAESTDYTGVAIPFPQESETDFSALEKDVSGSELADAADRLQEASEAARQAGEEVQESAREGWLADCGGEPMSLRERAGKLAGLTGAANPDYASPESWSFGAALLRARAYYASRVASEAPEGEGIEALTDSAVRAAFYGYALAEVRAGRYAELPDGSVDIELPRLPANTDQMRATRLYTDARWPCTQEPGGRTLHSTLSCPGAVGPSSGMASLAELEVGSAVVCATCDMEASDMGKVAAASTSIDNGFEHYWKRVVDASEAYEAARGRLAEAERAIAEAAGDGADAFERALEALAVPRPKLCPPGAWGCVSVVVRGQTSSPEELARAFVGTASVPAGGAVSAATLAPDKDGEGNDVLTRLFEAISEDLGEVPAGVLGTFGAVWGSLLVAYGSAADGLSSAVDRLVSGMDGTPVGGPAAWLRDKVVEIVRAAGFEPVDLRPRKPVLTNTQNVLDQAGYEEVSSARDLVGKLPDDADPATLARALGQHVANELDGVEFTVAEIPIPGTPVRIPLTIDVGQLLGAVVA